MLPLVTSSGQLQPNFVPAPLRRNVPNGHKCDQEHAGFNSLRDPVDHVVADEQVLTISPHCDAPLPEVGSQAVSEFRVLMIVAEKDEVLIQAAGSTLAD